MVISVFKDFFTDGKLSQGFPSVQKSLKNGGHHQTLWTNRVGAQNLKVKSCSQGEIHINIEQFLKVVQLLHVFQLLTLDSGRRLDLAITFDGDLRF